MKRIVTHNLPVMGNSSTVKLSIEERSVELAHYIIESKDTVRCPECRKARKQQKYNH